MSTIKTKLIAIITFLIIISINFRYSSEDIKQNSYEPNFDNIEYVKKDTWKNNEEISQGSRAPSSPNNLIENNNHGGSWVDNFRDTNGIESNINLTLCNFKSDRNNIRLNSDHLKFSDTFEGTDGTDINVYDSNYTINSTASSGNYDLEIDNAQSYEGTSSFLIHMTQWAKRTYVERSINLSKPVLELIYYIRIYCGPTNRDSHLGSENWFLLKAGNNLIAGIDFSGYNIRYPNSGSWTSTSISLSHSTWHKVRVVVYKNNGVYSNYDFDVWNTSDLQSPIFSRRNVNVYSAGHSIIDNFNISMGTTWETPPPPPFYNVWYDGISILENIFNTHGELVSKPITLSSGMTWDSFIINKTEQTNCSIEVNILNATNDQLIYGPITKDGEISIRDKVDSNLYPSIKLNATFYSNGSVTPILHYWGVSWNATNAWRDTLFGGLKEISKNLTGGNEEIWFNTSFTEWYKYSKNPILKVGSGSSWDNSKVTYPTIVFNGTGYMMWYRGYDGASHQIGLATSKDGITWTKYFGNPVLTTSTSGWDNRYLHTPCVLFDGEIYKMWYTGQDTLTDRRVGYATSYDGINWQKHSTNPVIDIGSTGQWDDHYAWFPYVYFDGLNYKMWYSGLNGSVGHYQVGYATSYNGFNWNKYPINPIISCKAGYYMGITKLCVFPQNNYYIGWYDSGNATGTLPRHINHTYSNDGIYWVNYTNNPILQKGNSGSWDQIMVTSPEIIYNDKHYFMYYTGRSGSASQIGLAKSKFNTSGFIISEPISLLDQNTHEMLLINKTESLGTFINISIIDNATGLTITNYDNIRGIVANLSGISRITYPVIRLKANFESTGYETPILHDWSIGMNTKPIVTDVSSPPKVNRTHSIKIMVNLTDNEEPEKDLNLTVEYKSPFDIIWQSTFVNTPNFNTDHWECTFTPPASSEVGLYSFRFICNDSLQDWNIYPNPHYIKVINNDPIILDINTNPISSTVNRTHIIIININTTDIENSSNELIINVTYKSPSDLTWQSSYISNIVFANSRWETNFTPGKNADLGWYTINITCNDTITEVYEEIDVQVINCNPIIWDIDKIPASLSINRTKTLKLIINTTDAENATNELKIDVKYKSPIDLNWQTSYISNINHKSGFWEVDFIPPKNAILGNYIFNVTCTDGNSAFAFINTTSIEVINNAPVIWSITTDTASTLVNRTITTNVIIDASDAETAANKLNVSVEYKSPSSTKWRTTYLTNLVYNNGYWKVDFTPPKNAQLGLYTVRVTCNDSDLATVVEIINLLVINNDPIIWFINTSTTETRVNRTHVLKLIIDASDVETSDENLAIEVRYRYSITLPWETEYLSEIEYIDGSWEVDFTPPKDMKLGTYTFNILCNDFDTEVSREINIQVMNNAPIISAAWPSESQVKRTESVDIIIDASDIEISSHNLRIDVKYKPLNALTWDSIKNQDIIYANGHWEAEFIPEKNAQLGPYIFNVTCNDTNTYVYTYLELDVINNIPTQPEVTIYPIEPKTMDGLNVLAINATDIETTNLEYWYYWYKDDIIMPQFENQTNIPYTETAKDQTWRCVVFPFDDDDVGPFGEAEITIQNSPAEVVELFDNIEMFEDIPIILEKQLTTTFGDPDDDELVFSSSKQGTIEIEIIQENGTIKLSPAENWFGTEYITFYATDTFSPAAAVTAQVIVKPTNDLPVIKQIGNQIVTEVSKELQFIVSQNDELNLSIVVEDIDGDVERGMIKYILNITSRNNLYFDESKKSIIFNPSNGDVGWLYINIKITDNNETPIVYISQDIQIEVLNVNDPPTVKITTPSNGKEFALTDEISFVCFGEDPDLLIDPEEELYYRWFTNHSEIGDVGNVSQIILADGTLQPGYYNITVEVTDLAGIKGYDYVNIVIKQQQKGQAETIMTSVYYWIIVLIIIILVIVGILLFLFNKKKRKKAEAPGITEEKRFQPPTVDRPPTISSRSTSPPTPPTQTAPGIQSQIKQKPKPSPPQTQLEIKINEQRLEPDSKLNTKQKLELLDERLLHGEIDQKLYIKLKTKYEKENKTN